MKARSTGLLACLLLFLVGCNDSVAPPVRAEVVRERPLVMTVNYPLAYFAERIGGEAFGVELPVPAGVDPAFWEPTAGEVVRYQKADLVLLNGAGYAHWTQVATLPISRTVDTSKGFPERLIARGDTTSHSHGPTGEHTHGQTAFTTWLDFDLAKRQAQSVHDALLALKPDAGPALQENMDSLARDLDELDADLRKIVNGDALPVIFSHPVYDYLMQRHAMHGASLHWEPDAAPTPEQWDELKTLNEQHQARWMIWEGEPLEATRAALLERGIESVVFAPCGNRPASGDWLSVMRANLQALAQVYGD